MKMSEVTVHQPPIGSPAERLHRKVCHNAITFLEQHATPAILRETGADYYSDPTALPLNILKGLSKRMEMPLSELVKNGIGSMRITVLDFQIMLYEERHF